MKITLSILAGIGFLVVVVAAVIGIALCPLLTGLLLLLFKIVSVVAVLIFAFAVGCMAYDRMTGHDEDDFDEPLDYYLDGEGYPE